MGIPDFLKLTLNDLAELSKIDKTRWSKYFNGQAIGERTLQRVSDRLNISPEDLLAAINLRRKQKELQKNAS